ncbi:hypothetical protein Ppa06_39600 [Planomonospora parontospora subsp. parontospora]|uniref:Uncharacterized protein n=2 Tax=Planomonospora parontospora TaxID=58119 RepID=A0AA37BI83_9ACTN|nr:hypothetical protein [Planomonospora parontospora]GGK76245.1 hypothetical protein GCM10010126_39320 [Planomonospora parontospora]GII10162.1 hypothetical protein Ppa06_39600 [Planomonospora parontospora subsp. parontospora]
MAAARDEVHRHVTRFQQLVGTVPAMCHGVGLTEAHHTAVDAYIEIMTAWMRGYHTWGTETARYHAALETLPSSVPGHFEDVLGS